jgi:hypothetical protein
MGEAIRQEVTVEQAGVLVIRSPRLSPGDRAEVTVVIDEGEKPAKHSLKSLIGTGKGCFATPEDADSFIRQERDAWQ